MKPVLLTERFRALLRAYPKEVRAEADRRITEVQTAFGDPPRHAGLGIRKISRRHYEIRAHLDVRLVFTAEEPEGLVFDFVGDHDSVRRFLRSQ